MSFSSRVKACATSTVKSGVAALRMEDSPLGICCCDQAMRPNGMTFEISPSIAKALASGQSSGMLTPLDPTR